MIFSPYCQDLRNTSYTWCFEPRFVNQYTWILLDFVFLPTLPTGNHAIIIQINEKNIHMENKKSLLIDIPLSNLRLCVCSGERRPMPHLFRIEWLAVRATTLTESELLLFFSKIRSANVRHVRGWQRLCYWAPFWKMPQLYICTKIQSGRFEIQKAILHPRTHEFKIFIFRSFFGTSDNLNWQQTSCDKCVHSFSVYIRRQFISDVLYKVIMK